MSCWHPYTYALLVYWCSYRMAVKSVFPYCVRTMHILPNLVTNNYYILEQVAMLLEMWDSNTFV